MRTAALLFALQAAAQVADRPAPSRDHVAIQYSTTQQSTGVESMGPVEGGLREILAALKVPVESQIVVFSKTSLQSPLITPRNPRSLYFNDSVAVGMVPGGILEVAAHDPKLGTVFYRGFLAPNAPAALLRSDANCLSCHEAYSTLGIPGMLTKSVPVGPTGKILPWLGNYTSDHSSAFEERWGGWFVTGSLGSVKHLGNVVMPDPDSTPEPVALPARQALTPHSDVVALMVFEHQMHLMNLLTRLAWESRTGGRVDDVAEEAASYMLFEGEAKLPNPISGSSDYAKVFAAQGPFDPQGRSLRQFDLKTRLMRYPLSYMIYSPSFDDLPATAKEQLYAKLWAKLSSSNQYRETVEILMATKPRLPSYFHLLK